MNSYDELQDLLTYWYDCTDSDLSYHGDLPEWLHPDVAEFYRRFGELTLDDGNFQREGLAHTLGTQDYITPVNKLERQDDGAVILLGENQGCWTAGQVPGSDMLWSSIDPESGETPYPLETLFDMQFPLKEALITHVLHETVMSSVDCGSPFDLAETDYAEEKIQSMGTIIHRRYITADGLPLTIAWADEYLALSWHGAENSFDWIVRKGDREKGLTVHLTKDSPTEKPEVKRRAFSLRGLFGMSR